MNQDFIIEKGILKKYTGEESNVIIPEGVTSIGAYAFSIIRQKYYVASENSVLINITIPNTVTSIGAGAFEECINLTDVTIPDSVTTIGDSAFCRCSSLQSIIIPNGVTYIGKHAFFGCSSLTNVTIPDSVTHMGKWAFDGCSKEMVFNITNAGANRSENFKITQSGKLSEYKGLGGNVIIPEGVITIGGNLLFMHAAV